MIATNSISTAIADTEHLTLVDLLADRAARQGDRTAFIFLENGEKESAGLSYDRLNRQARTIAEHLSLTVQPGDRVLLIYPSGIDFIAAFFGCLYAGVVAVPVHPPRPNRSMERLQSILNDAGAKIALTTAAIREMVDRRMSKEPELGLVDWIVTEIADLETGDRWQPPKIDSNTLAFLQYTSGSTGQPKGVMVSHGNILHNLAYSQQAFGLTAADVSVTWLPNFHDLGLIDGILQPIFSGILGVLMPSAAFVQKPIRWLQAISHYKATHSGGPNFAYDLCTSKITAEQMQDVDLSSWVSAYNGAEPIRAETLTKFAERFALYGYQSHFHYPSYGMAEATLVITGGEAVTAPAICTVDGEALAQDRIVLANSHTRHPRTLVSCGRTWLDTRVVIVNPDTQILCLEQQVGEIWTAGGSVAQGYWQRPVETQGTFHAYLQDTKTGPFLRTGDLGFVQDGELFVTGRLKDVVIVRGSNYYPQDIEQTVDRSHPYLRPSGSAVFGISVANTEQLVVVAEVERQYSHRHQDIKTGGEVRAVTDWDDVFGQIRRAVASEHELEVYAIVLLRRGHILKTSSGKIQRRGCKAAFWEDSLEKVAEFYLDPDFNRSQYAPAFATPQAFVQNHGPKSVIADSPKERLRQRSDIWIDPTQVQADRLVQWLRDYAKQRINSLVIDERRCIPPYIVLDFGNQGLLGMQVPAAYGGKLALSHTSTLRIFEQLSAIDSTISLFTILNNVLGIRPILNYGHADLKAELLPDLAAGRELGAFALTEPGAGSNPQNIISRAVPVGDRSWQLYGHKIWSGSAAWAGSINVFTNELDDRGHPKGITGFVVRQGSAGLRQGPEALTMGMRGMVQNSIYLEGVRVESQQMLGESGVGMTVAQDAMTYGRLSIAALCLGGMKRCAQLMVNYASQRTIATGQLLDNPIAILRLSDLTAAITTVEVLVKGMARSLDCQISLPIDAYTICKIIVPELFWQAADHLVQMLGGRGYVETNIAPQLLRDARILRIFEGPTEALKMFLGSRIVHQPEEFCKFLIQGLGAVEVESQLMHAVTEIQARQQAESVFTDSVTASRWAQVLIGELASWSYLLAMLQQAVARQAGNDLTRAIAWVSLHWEQALIRATTLSPAEQVVMSVADLNDTVSRYHQDIGEIEQTLPGEDRELDLLLRQSPAGIIPDSTVGFDRSLLEHIVEQSMPQSGGSTNEATLDPTFNLADDVSTARLTSIQTWIVTWLAEHFRFAPSMIQSNHTFAEYGIDSVTAVEFIYDLQSWLNTQVELEISWLWQFPTISDFVSQIDRVTTVTSSDRSELSVDPSLDLDVEAILDPSIRAQTGASGVITPPVAILLTGGTGFLGAFLLRDLLRQTTATIYCLVRCPDSIDGLNRLQQNLEYYQIWDERDRHRIVAIPGDLEQFLFGWSESDFQTLAANVDTIYHSGAAVNWVYAYADLKHCNVLGTQEVLRFASQGKLKSVHYISTVAVFESPDYAHRTISETDCAIHSKGLYLGYSQSKWVAEQLLLQARDRGIPVTIYRPPLISGDSQTGAWFTGDFSCRLIKGCIQMGMFPDLDYWFDMSPVDYVSKAIVHLSQNYGALASKHHNLTHHLMNPQGMHWQTLFEQIQQMGYPLERVTYSQWRDRLQQSLPKENPLYALLPFLLKQRTDLQLTALELYQQQNACKFDCQQTVQTLVADNLLCPPLDRDLLTTYFSYFVKTGYL